MRLYRSRDDVVVSGVLAGLGEYFNVDPTILRIAFVLLVFMNVFPLIPLYILGAFIIPKAPKDKDVQRNPKKRKERPRTEYKGYDSQKSSDPFRSAEVKDVEEEDWSDF
jgi:phage shock protein PspC (stress-responsive transcriptional regulator)